MSYVSNLQSTWDRYVVMKQTDLIQACDPQSAAFEPDFAQAISIIYEQRLFGFQDYTGSCAGPNNGNNKYIGRCGGG
jgi:hypothetical protein